MRTLFLAAICPTLPETGNEIWEQNAILEDPGQSFEQCVFNYDIPKTCSMIKIEKEDEFTDEATGIRVHHFRVIVSSMTSSTPKVTLNISFSHDVLSSDVLVSTRLCQMK